MGSRGSIFSIFGHRRQDQRKWAPEVRFSAFSATGARIGETGPQRFDFLHFRKQAARSPKMNSRGSIFNIFGHRRKDQRKWAQEARFSAFSATGLKINETGLQRIDFQHLRSWAPRAAKLNSIRSICSFAAFSITSVKISETDFQDFRQ